MTELSFVVHGVAQPAGSKRGFVHPKTGRVVITDANAKSRPWKVLVANAAADARDAAGVTDLLEGPLSLLAVFYVARPKGHYRTGRNVGLLRASAPAFPTVKPDATKLLRGLEDAMTGVVWRDDAQVVQQTVRKAYGMARVEVHVATLPVVHAVPLPTMEATT